MLFEDLKIKMNLKKQFWLDFKRVSKFKFF